MLPLRASWCSVVCCHSAREAATWSHTHTHTQQGTQLNTALFLLLPLLTTSGRHVYCLMHLHWKLPETVHDGQSSQPSVLANLNSMHHAAEDWLYEGECAHVYYKNNVLTTARLTALPFKTLPLKSLTIRVSPNPKPSGYCPSVKFLGLCHQKALYMQFPLLINLSFGVWGGFQDWVSL